MTDSRFIIGVDLGTTTISVFYIDTHQQGFKIQPFKIPQLTEAGEIHELSLLPSFCYLPQKEEFPEESLRLPWQCETNYFVGSFARSHGASVPSRLISSAKSWLAHAGVDRTKPILPWNNNLGTLAKSPVEVSSHYLKHLKEAWNHRFKNVKDKTGSPCFFEEQQILITIPASFDEVARELTLKATHLNALQNVSLVEEPLAAFYAWLYKHEQNWQEKIRPGERILVIDVGGGTTDFSIIEMNEDKSLNRFAVGEHLLLGGDNIDMAIAKKIEEKWQKTLESNSWAELCQLCRKAKETLLTSQVQKVDITLILKGSSVIKNVMRAEFHHDEILSLLENGFYPHVALCNQTSEKRRGIRQMGLPYAENPAITHHLLQFLAYAGQILRVKERNGNEGSSAMESKIRQEFYSNSQGEHPSQPDDFASLQVLNEPEKTVDGEMKNSLCYPDKILFNGGSLTSKFVRDRVHSVLSTWFPNRPQSQELEGEDLSLAVAIGAAYYGKVRRGLGVKVKGGIARSYYLEVSDDREARKVVCVLPRDTEENIPIILPNRFLLHANENVLFNLYSSATRLLDHAGDTLEDLEEITLVAPLISVLQFGGTSKKSIEVKVCTEETEIGVLKVQLNSQISDHIWPLHFDVRANLQGQKPLETKDAESPTRILDQNKISSAENLLKETFECDKNNLNTLTQDLEVALGVKKNLWSLSILRNFADAMIQLERTRKKSPEHEMRWLNLLGYCLRPGFGAPGDEFRLRESWKFWFGGLAHPKNFQVNAEWWIMWRRIGPGLKSGHQTMMATVLKKHLLPKNTYRPKFREGEQAKREMWRCMGALELIPIHLKISIATILIDRLPKLEPYEIWTLARLGSRKMFHASENFIIPPNVVEGWLKKLLSISPLNKKNNLLPSTIARIASFTGVRNLDITQEMHAHVLKFLESNEISSEVLESISQKTMMSVTETEKFLADTLPIGLSFVE